MRATFRNCVSAEDYAQFTLYFIRNRQDFSVEFTLCDTLFHIIDSIDQSQIILIFDPMNTVIGWGHYRYVNTQNQHDPAGEIVFVESVIVSKEYRSTRLFVTGLCYLVNQIARENTHVRLLQFRAQEQNVYLNRLYSKFAQISGQHEGNYGMENLYSSEFQRLQSYLNRVNRAQILKLTEER